MTGPTDTGQGKRKAMFSNASFRSEVASISKQTGVSVQATQEIIKEWNYRQWVRAMRGPGWAPGKGDK